MDDNLLANMPLSDRIKMRSCGHCESEGISDLQVYEMLLAHEGEEPEKTVFVYCSNCGHWGDLNTWNNTPPKYCCEPLRKMIRLGILKAPVSGSISWRHVPQVVSDSLESVEEGVSVAYECFFCGKKFE